MTLLEREIKYIKAKYEYYILCAPTMLDSDFDKLESSIGSDGSVLIDMVDFDIDAVVEFADKNGLDVNEICPGSKIKRDEKKYAHYTPMLSLKKIQVNDESSMPYHEFELFTGSHDSEYIEGSSKYDGSSMEIIYEYDDKLSLHNMNISLTRGDKKKGLDKTNKMKLLVPNQLKLDGYSDKIIEVRGEVVMDKKVFMDKYSEENANARNTVAGILNRDEISYSDLNDLTFVAYSIVLIDKVSKKLEYPPDSMDLLSIIGFNTKHTPFLVKSSPDSNGFDEIYTKFKKYRHECPFLMDGIVIKFPEKYRAKMGNNGHHPHFAVAIKFPSTIVSTTIANYLFSIGKDGHITPVALLEPVEFDGSIVTRASMSNIGVLYDNGLFPGTVVTLKKSGEIIPYITGVVEKSPDHEEYLKLFEKSYLQR